jgi:hypothetical protein
LESGSNGEELENCKSLPFIPFSEKCRINFEGGNSLSFIPFLDM